jgi:uncharacterized membrane protein
VGVLVLFGVALWLQPHEKPAKAAAPVAAVAPAASAQGQNAPAPAAAAATAAADGTVGWAQMGPFFQSHCVMCHGPAIQQKGVRLDAPDTAKAHAQQIYQQVVQLRKMPFGNPGSLSDDERDMVKRWYESGASTN